MHVYTHFLIGGALGTLIYHENPDAQTAFLFGSILPDIVMIPLFVIDRITKLQGMKRQGELTNTLREIFHSLPLVFFVKWMFFASSVEPKALLSGMFLHIMIDGLTHCGESYAKTDQSCIWPFHNYFPKMGAVCGQWEYRYARGVFTPKPFEATVCFVSIGLWTLLLLI